jgi:hypothetical protein
VSGSQCLDLKYAKRSIGQSCLVWDPSFSCNSRLDTRHCVLFHDATSNCRKPIYSSHTHKPHYSSPNYW